MRFKYPSSKIKDKVLTGILLFVVGSALILAFMITSFKHIILLIFGLPFWIFGASTMMAGFSRKVTLYDIDSNGINIINVNGLRTLVKWRDIKKITENPAFIEIHTHRTNQIIHKDLENIDEFYNQIVMHTTPAFMRAKMKNAQKKAEAQVSTQDPKTAESAQTDIKKSDALIVIDSPNETETLTKEAVAAKEKSRKLIEEIMSTKLTPPPAPKKQPAISQEAVKASSLESESQTASSEPVEPIPIFDTSKPQPTSSRPESSLLEQDVAAIPLSEPEPPKPQTKHKNKLLNDFLTGNFSSPKIVRKTMAITESIMMSITGNAKDRKNALLEKFGNKAAEVEGEVGLVTRVVEDKPTPFTGKLKEIYLAPYLEGEESGETESEATSYKAASVSSVVEDYAMKENEEFLSKHHQSSDVPFNLGSLFDDDFSLNQEDTTTPQHQTEPVYSSDFVAQHRPPTIEIPSPMSPEFDVTLEQSAKAPGLDSLFDRLSNTAKLAKANLNAINFDFNSLNSDSSSKEAASIENPEEPGAEGASPSSILGSLPSFAPPSSGRRSGSLSDKGPSSGELPPVSLSSDASPSGSLLGSLLEFVPPETGSLSSVDSGASSSGELKEPQKSAIEKDPVGASNLSVPPAAPTVEATAAPALDDLLTKFSTTGKLSRSHLKSVEKELNNESSAFDSAINSSPLQSMPSPSAPSSSDSPRDSLSDKFSSGKLDRGELFFSAEPESSLGEAVSQESSKIEDEKFATKKLSSANLDNLLKTLEASSGSLRKKRKKNPENS